MEKEKYVLKREKRNGTICRWGSNFMYGLGSISGGATAAAVLTSDESLVWAISGATITLTYVAMGLFLANKARKANNKVKELIKSV